MLLDAAPEYYRDYYIVRIFTGMRTAEIDGLKRKYVDLDNGLIHIRETIVKGEMAPPKNDQSYRSITMSSFVYDAMKRQLEVTKNRSDFVFCNTHGNPLKYHNVNRNVWYPLLERAGLERRRAYQTRHTAATLWLASGENPEWIAKQMGHVSTKMLFTVYSNYVPNLIRVDGSALEELLNSYMED
ncbi:site-specific integrase [Cardiobacteriaceae bacterium TAE3-ERU3]|nr:site-specific integrase [Cardiobacteriaceae bacterium TAE3-ERU3]